MANLYKEASDETKAALHAQLDAYWKCKGKACP
jgi:hypothetical protein